MNSEQPTLTLAYFNSCSKEAQDEVQYLPTNNAGVAFLMGGAMNIRTSAREAAKVMRAAGNPDNEPFIQWYLDSMYAIADFVDEGGRLQDATYPDLRDVLK